MKMCKTANETFLDTVPDHWLRSRLGLSFWKLVPDLAVSSIKILGMICQMSYGQNHTKIQDITNISLDFINNKQKGLYDCKYLHICKYWSGRRCDKYRCHISDEMMGLIIRASEKYKEICTDGFEHLNSGCAHHSWTDAHWSYRRRTCKHRCSLHLPGK